MSNTTGPIYEVTLSVDREIIDAFDAWLSEHVREMLGLPGFLKAETFELETGDEERARRVTHYYLASEEDLEQYLAGPATEMRRSAADLFAARFEASGRVLRRSGDVEDELRTLSSCLNCGTTLTGQYCGNCGQRARSRLISIWELLREAFGDLFELDSRLWQTLVPLVIRPGQLTRDYLCGRRARFMPPFRTYLVLSVLFFVIAFFDPKDELNLLFEPATETSEATAPEAEAPTAPNEDDSTGVNINVSDGEADVACDVEDFESADIPDWLSRRMTPERLRIMCDRVTADDGRALIDKLLDNVPVALFVLLPLMALVLKILYPLSQRYYVEHLLFVVHYHAFFFLMLLLQVLFVRLSALTGFPEEASLVVLIGASLYIPVYLFTSMRRVYGQGVTATTLKFVCLIISYLIGFLLMIGFAALFAAFSI